MSSRFPKPATPTAPRAPVHYTYTPSDYPPGLVAIPATEWMWTRSAEAFMQLVPGLPPGSSMSLCQSISASPALNRNSLTDAFLKRPELKWILYLDSDMTPVPAMTARLLSHNVDVVGGMYFTRHPPFQGCWQPLSSDPIDAASGTIQEVRFVGTGAMLVRRRVIEAIPYPWFEHPAPGMGEDVLFCDKARAIGMKVYVDCGMQVGHLSVQPITARESGLAQAYPVSNSHMPEQPAGLDAVLTREHAAALERTTGTAAHETKPKSGRSIPFYGRP